MDTTMIKSKNKLADIVIDKVYNCKCKCHTGKKGEFGCDRGCICYVYLEPMLEESGIPIKHKVIPE